MEVTVKSSCIVRPAEQTWSGRIPLSELDMVGILTDVQVIYFYRPSADWLIPQDRIYKTLHDSLTKVLVEFYPLAGRLHPLGGGRFELDCNNKGAVLIQAESPVQFDDLGDLMLSPVYLESLIPQIDYASLPYEEIPLLALQLTKFDCGGVTLSFTVSHVAADGQSGLQFLTRFSQLTLGDAKLSGDVPPCFNTKLLRAAEPAAAPPRFQSFHHPEFDPPPLLVGALNGDAEREKETTDVLLKLSRAQVEALKNEANKTRPDPAGRPYSRYEVVTAHVWRCSCKARGHVKEQPTVMAITVNIRPRVRPPLPPTYFFNGIHQVIAKSRSGEVTAEPLGHVAGKIRSAIDSVTDEYVQSAIDHLKNVKDLSPYQDIHAIKTGEGPNYGNPSLGSISWLGFPLQGMDFGWGKEIFMAPRTHDCDGDALIFPSGDGDGSVIVALCLQTEHMEDFRKVFYDDIPVEE